MTNTATDQIEVKPVKGALLPLEHNPSRYVDKKMTVRDSAYYRRAIATGTIAMAKSKKRKPTSSPKED